MWNGSEWVDVFASKVLYNYGDERISVTGGWTTALRIGGSGSEGYCNKTASSISMYGINYYPTYQSSPNAYANNLLSFKSGTKICVDATLTIAGATDGDANFRIQIVDASNNIILQQLYMPTTSGQRELYIANVPNDMNGILRLWINPHGSNSYFYGEIHQVYTE